MTRDELCQIRDAARMIRGVMGASANWKIKCRIVLRTYEQEIYSLIDYNDLKSMYGYYSHVTTTREEDTRALARAVGELESEVNEIIESLDSLEASDED